MEKLPKPLIALINSVIEDYDNFSWTSVYLGDKMRISLVWTRGETIQKNGRSKHKSKSALERDAKRLEVWHENRHADIDTSVIDDQNDKSIEDMEASSERECFIETNIDNNIPQGAPSQVTTSDLPEFSQPAETINNGIQRTIESTGAKSRTSVTRKMDCVFDDKQNSEIKPIAPPQIITGRSPCKDTHYQKVVCRKSSLDETIIGRVKMKNILVVKIKKYSTRKWAYKHVCYTDDDKTEYENYMHYLDRYRDVRKSEDEDIRAYATEIPGLDRYAEKYKLCPFCFAD